MRIPIEGSNSYRDRHARPNWAAFLASIVLALTTGAVGALFSPGITTSSTETWYAGLQKPTWTPPNSWFGPIWTILYVLMGLAAWLIWSERYHPKRRFALTCYAVQLLVNALWAPIFFGARSIGGGLFLIVALWLVLAWTLREFASVRAAAAWLLAPYLAWVTVAMALNLSIWRFNAAL
jgi:tryptophan-rich sensory protein